METLPILPVIFGVLVAFFTFWLIWFLLKEMNNNNRR
jgi:hypothetical protein